MATKRLSKESYETASHFLLHSVRALERGTYNHYFNGASSKQLLIELQNFQNPDGGFGYGLEPDLRLPFSSPVVTSVAFQHLVRLDRRENHSELTKAGIRYFEKTFHRSTNRWFAVPKNVNDYPHAPWWHFDENKNQTPIDKYWGNPTAEIIAYLLKYDRFVDDLDLEGLLKTAVQKLNEKREFESEHEVFCYLRLYKVLPPRWSKKIKPQLVRAVQQLVCSDSSEWNSYVPQPLHFVDSPESPKFGISNHLLEENLNFLIDKLEENGVISPSWEWNQYKTEWERAKKEWTGILTLKALIVLDKFGRIAS